MTKKTSGFSLIEVLIAIVILGITLVPAMNALRTGMKGTEVHQNFQEQHYLLTSKMEEVLAEPFSDLQAVATAAAHPLVNSSYSDATFYVYVYPYDVDDSDNDHDVFTDDDLDVIWVEVELVDSGMSLETLAAP